jgi:hypothetical protein
MRNYCLSVDETDQILKWRDGNEITICKQLAFEIDEAKCWSSRIICLALFVARLIQRGQTSIEEQKNIIEKIYSMSDLLYFEIQEGDCHFVNYLLRHIRNSSDSLEDTLIEIQNGLSRYYYEKAIRY